MYSGGSGTINDPYLIANATDLNDVRNNLSSYFKQIKDIDIDVAPYNTGTGWNPITIFSGVYDGRGFCINGLYINRDANLQGLFGTVTGTIRNVCMTNVQISFDLSYDPFRVGSIAGLLSGTALIEKCWAKSGSIFASTTSIATYIGGIVGSAGDSGCIIQDCKSDINVTGYDYVSGIAGNGGEGFPYATIRRCFVGNPDADIRAADHPGGIAGRVGVISYCVAYLDSILYTTGSNAARISNGGTLTENYAWDAISISGGSVSDPNGDDGEDKTLTELKTKSTYETDLGWDFETVWAIKQGEIPRLRIFDDKTNAIFFGTNF